MRPPDEADVIVNRAIGRRILGKHAENRVVELETRVIADLDLDSERFRAGLNDGDCLWMTIIGDEERFPIWNDRMTKRHRFGGGSGFVKQSRVRNIQRR